jgi:hypothetical protein
MSSHSSFYVYVSYPMLLKRIKPCANQIGDIPPPGGLLPKNEIQFLLNWIDAVIPGNLIQISQIIITAHFRKDERHNTFVTR